MAQASESIGRGRRDGAARNALKARTNDVLSDFAELRRDVGRLADAATKAARAEARSAGHRLQRLGHDMRARAGDGVDYVSGQVRAHPGAAVGMALGTGLLLGLMLGGRR